MKKIGGGFTDHSRLAAAADRDDISHLFGSIEIYAFLNQIRLKSYRVIPKKIDTIMLIGLYHPVVCMYIVW